MNPTSAGTRSPRYVLPPSSSSFSQKEALEHAPSPDQTRWDVVEGCFFPVYSKSENELFRETFDQMIQEISLNLKKMIACVWEISPEAIATPWKAFSILASCLGDDLSKQIPLSIFTSSINSICIKDIEHSSPTKKKKSSISADTPYFRNKTCSAVQKLANSVSSTLAFLQISVQLDKLKEKNPESYQTSRAFQYAISKRFSVERSASLDNFDIKLSEKIISAIAPQGDTCSHEARFQLLKSATSEFTNRQNSLIADVYTFLASQKKHLPLTGKGVLAICIKHSTRSINVSANIEWLPSWKKLIFRYLARTFLQKMNVRMTNPTNVQFLLNTLKPYLSTCSSTVSQDETMQSATNFLAKDFVDSFFLRSSRCNTPNFNLNICYNEFAQCSSSITSLLKGFFILETGMCFSSQNLFSFQKYAQTLDLPNSTEEITSTIQEIASICAEEHQNALTSTRSLLETTSTLFRQIIFQSVKIAFDHKKGCTNNPLKDIIYCQWIPEEMFQSILFCNYWKEAIWAHHSGMLLEEQFCTDSKTLASTISDTSAQLKTTFQQLCCNLLMDVLEKMPLEHNEKPLPFFLEKARALQTNMIPKYAPTSYLFTIVIEFIAKPDNFVARNLMLGREKQNFQEKQKDFALYIYKYFIQHENTIPETPQALFSHLKNQCTGITQIPTFLEKLPFWKECIFQSLAHIFLQQKQEPIPVQNNLEHTINILQSHFLEIKIAQKSLSYRLTSFTQALAESLRIMQIESIRIVEHTPSTIDLNDDTQYQKFFQSITSCNTLMQAFFKLDTGKNLSSKNLCFFQKYIHNFLPHIVNLYMKEIILGSFAIYLEETQLLDENSEEIKATLATISILQKQLLEGALTILIFCNKAYKKLSPQSAVTAAFRLIHSDACIPESLILSLESRSIWKKLIQNPPKKDLLLEIPNYFERTEKMYSETASVITQCFLKLCQKVLMHTSKEVFLEYATEQSFQKQNQKRTEIVSIVYPRIILEPDNNKIKFKELVSYLATDALHTNNNNVLLLALENFLKAQQHFVKHACIHLIQQKLALPLTGEKLLTLCKKQYRSTTPFPLWLSQLPSWNNHIFYSLTYVFLFKNQKNITPDFYSWNPKTVINNIAPFFSQATKLVNSLPLEIQIKTFTMCLKQYFNSDKSLNIHDTETLPYACRAYENFLQSAILLKKFFKIFISMEFDKKCSSQQLQQLQTYIAKLLINEPELRRTDVLQDVSIICSEETQFLGQSSLTAFWEDLIRANCLLEDFMEISLALVMLCEPTNTEITPSRTLDIALQIISTKKSFPTTLNFAFTSFINSLSGTNALQKAVNAYLSSTLCFQIFEKLQILPNNIEENSLQTTIDASIEGRVCPQTTEWIDVLSSVLIYNKEPLENLCQKLYITLQTDVAATISKEPLVGTPSQHFIKTANTCHAKMISENHPALPLFQSFVLILAQNHEEELQKNLQEDFTSFITTAEVSTNEAVFEQEDNLTTTPAIETDVSIEALWPGIKAILSSEDLTDLHGYALSPSSSPASKKPKSDHAPSLDEEEWNVRNGCVFPVYSERKIQEFRKKFDQNVKEISLHLQMMMACLLENACDSITTPWKAFSRLVSCLGEDLPKQIPLSIFTSSVGIACIKNIKGYPDAKKRKLSDSSEEAALRNKILTSAQQLANAISSTLDFLQTDLLLNSLQEKNQDSLQATRAFQYAVSQKFSVELSTAFDNDDYELAKRIISVISPKGDTCSKEARDQLLKSATSEFASTQELLICDAYTDLAYQKKRLPLTGQGLLSVCIQNSENPISVSANIEWLPSWQRLIFCYLARTFLQNRNVHILDPTDFQSLLAALAPYFSICSSRFYPTEKMQYITNFLAENFVRSCSARASRNHPPNLILSIRYNEFLQCSSSITNLLKGFFILETNMCFSSQNLSSFQQYTKTLLLPNSTEIINNTIQEVASICGEEHQNAIGCTKSLLEKTSTLLRQLIFQSVKIAFTTSPEFKNKSPKEIVHCEWMPEELFQSIPFCNYWKEAIWAQHAGTLLGENLANDLTTLISTRSNTSDQLKNTFQQLCYNLLRDVLAEMPLEYAEKPLLLFLEKAQTLQTNMIPKYAPTSYLFAIAIKFIAKPENFIARNLMFDIETQKFQESQKDFIFCVYNFFIQKENFIPKTPQALFAHLRKQDRSGRQIPLFLEKLPFWQEYIFRFLAHVFLQQKQEPITDQHSLDYIITILQRHFPEINIRKRPLSNQLTSLTQALSEALCSMKINAIRIAENIPEAIALHNNTQYQAVIQSIASFNTCIQAFFKLDTGKNLSSKNLLVFQKYIYNFLLYISNSYVREIISGSFAIYLEETQLLDENSEKIHSTLATISVLLKELLEGAITILILHNKCYKRLSPQSAVTAAFQLIHSDSAAPENLLLSEKSFKIWEETKKNPPKKNQLSKIPNHFERTEKVFTAVASDLTQCFLTLCEKILMGTSRELFLQCATEQSIQKQKQKRDEIISCIYPKIILEDYYNQSELKNLILFLETDMLNTSNPNVLKLAIANFLTAQQHLVKDTYIYSIQQKLALPLTGANFLFFCKKQYRSTTFFPLSLSTLPSWSNRIFCSLATIFLLSNQMQIAPNCSVWDLKDFITNLAPFFPKVTKATENLPLETQIKTFTLCLEQYFKTAKSINIHNTDTHSYACRAYENFLRSAVVLKDLVRIFFTIETGKKHSSKNLQQFQSYIGQLLVNAPDLQRTSTLQDIAIICSEESQSSEQDIRNFLWEDLIHANFLLENIIELSLALVMLCEPTAKELTSSRTVDIALQSISSKQLFPIALTPVFTAFINSLSGTNALQKAVNAYSSGMLCAQIIETIQVLPKGVDVNSLQMTIDASIAGLLCPQIAECTNFLSSLLLAKKEELETLCKKLYISLKTDVTAAIPTEPFAGTPSQNFIQTANICYATMISENHPVLPLFQTIVFILAKTCENELQKEIHESFDSSITTADISTAEEGPEELPDNIWQEIQDTLLAETNEAVLVQESNLKTIPATETEQSLDELWPGIEELLSADDFTDLLGQGEYVLETENIEFEPEEEDTS